MLALSRKPGESIKIGENVIVKVIKIHPSGRVTLGFVAPRSVVIQRMEVIETQEKGDSNE